MFNLFHIGVSSPEGNTKHLVTPASQKLEFAALLELHYSIVIEYLSDCMLDKQKLYFTAHIFIMKIMISASFSTEHRLPLQDSMMANTET